MAGSASAAATLTLSGGVAAYVGSDGVNNSLTVSLSGTTYTFADTGETITLSGFTGGTGSGTNTITFSTTNNTISSFTINPGTGTNVTNLQSLGVSTTVTTTGTDTANISGNAPSNSSSTSNITANITLTTTSGTLTATTTGGSYSSGQTITIGSNSVTGFLGATGSYTLNFSAAGGTFTQLRLLDNFSSANLTAIVNNPAVKIVTDLTSGLGGASKTWNIKSVGVASSSFNSGSGNDTYVVGTAAGSTAGCDAIPAITLAAAAGTNSLQIDDTGSASGNKTIGVNNTTITGLGTGTFTYSALGGNLNNGLSLLGSSIGGNTWNIAALASTSQLSITGGSGGDTYNLNGTVSKAALAATGGTNSFNFPVDAKTIASPGTVTGSTGADTLSYAGRTTAVTVNVTSDGVDGAGGTATGMTSFSKINNFVGPTSGGGTLDVSGVSGTTDNGLGTLTFTSGRTVTYSGFTITGASSSNTAPTFTSGPSDGGSYSGSPTNVGNNVTFTATATDTESNNYYLAVCKTNSITAVNSGAPTCPGGSWAISSSTASGAQASVIYTTLSGDSASNAWFAFVCDNNSSSLCSASSQGSGNNGSPFAVNHSPTFSAITNTSGYIKAGNTVTFTSTASDSDSDNVQLFVCKANDFTGTSCGAGGEWAHSSATSSNPTATYTVQSSDGDGSHTYYANIIDAFNFQSTSNPISGTFTTDVTAPTVSAGSDQSVTATFTTSATASDATSGIASYQWSKTSGSGTVTFGSDTALNTTITATDGTYVITLTVTDNAGNIGTSSFNLTWSTPVTVGHGGGGLPPGAYDKPVGPFLLLINNGQITTNNQNVVLSIGAGSNVVRMALANSPDFYGSGQEPYATTKLWKLTDGEGIKTVYIKFYTKYGVWSDAISASIDYKTSVTPPSSKLYFTRYLGYGDYGTDVLRLQQILQILGFFPATVQPNGNYGPVTTKAVKQFQKAHSINPAGVVGPITKKALNSLP